MVVPYSNFFSRLFIMINRIYNLIDLFSGEDPVSVIRLGNVEATQMLKPYDEIYSQMKTNAGFFGDDIKSWKADVLRSMLTADVSLKVYTCPSFSVVDDVINKFQVFIPTLPYVEDVSFWISFIDNLPTNNLCFVSYFTEEMQKQVPLMNWIYPKKIRYKKNPRDWKFVFSENTIAGNEPKDKTYNEVLEDLFQRCLKQDADVYFLSCGCYGLPLQYKLKEAGKKSIYVGGLMQLLFGLKGKRWDERKIINQHYNKYWKYPTKKPKNSELVEGWCYGGDNKKSSPLGN